MLIAIDEGPQVAAVIGVAPVVPAHLQQGHPLSGAGQLAGHRGAARAGANHHHVGFVNGHVLRHDTPPVQIANFPLAQPITVSGAGRTLDFEKTSKGLRQLLEIRRRRRAEGQRKGIEGVPVEHGSLP